MDLIQSPVDHLLIQDDFAVFIHFSLPLPLKELVESQPLNAWRVGNTRDMSLPLSTSTVCIVLTLSLSSLEIELLEA